jgi:hypothetical protein
MHQVFISFPFSVKHEKKKEFAEFCAKKKIQIIDKVRDQKIEAWNPSGYSNTISVRFKDTTKFDLTTDKEFYKFTDASRILFIKLFISGKHTRYIEIWQLDLYGKFTCITDRTHSVNHMTLLDLGWVVNQTCHFGMDDLYYPEDKPAIS